MTKGKAFVLVGHSHWGKSFTLNELTKRYGGGKKRQSVTIKQEKIPVKKMSNDDEPWANLFGFINKMIASQTQTIIIPLCPNFSDGRKKETENILNILKHSYDIFFMVLMKAQAPKDDREIQDSEILDLKNYGEVTEIAGRFDYTERAESFKAFVEKNL